MDERSSVEEPESMMVNIVSGLAPIIYKDAFQKSVKSVGAGLEAITDIVVDLFVDGARFGDAAVRHCITRYFPEKMSAVPIEDIVMPNVGVVGPLFDQLRFVVEEDDLRNMYLNLLANSMDSKQKNGALPSFVQIIRSLSSDEAMIMKLLSVEQKIAMLDVLVDLKKSTVDAHEYDFCITKFSLIGTQASCESPDLVPCYLDNLVRLGLAEIPVEYYENEPEEYDELERLVRFTDEVKKEIDSQRELVFKKRTIQLTSLGQLFCKVCVKDKA